MKKLYMLLGIALIMVIAGSGCDKVEYIPLPPPSSSAKAITSFVFISPVAVGIITEATHTIAITVPFGTVVTALVPTITHTGASINPASGVANDFSSAKTYTVTAADASTQAYVVTVTVALSPAKAITAFTFPTSTGTTIDESAHTIAVAVPDGTDVTGLIPTITHTGASISPDTGAAHDFTSPATYTVTAANASTQAYTVTLKYGYISANIGTLKYVPAGSFLRDGNNSNLNVSTITTDYRMSKYEITRAQFLAVMGADPSDGAVSTGMTDPVQRVNWYHAIVFCNKLSIDEGLTPVYSITGVNFATLLYGDIPIISNDDWNAATATWANNGYRLPTEMEWEWAAMGATSGSGWTSPTYLTGYGKLFAGSDSILANGTGGTHVIGDYAWTSENSSSTSHPVGTKLANELGLYDMTGNVFEWVWDWNDSYPTGTQTNFRGAASGWYRVVRGGCWHFTASEATVAYRGLDFPYYQDYGLGFRVVRN